MTLRARIIPFLAICIVVLSTLLLTEVTLQILTRAVPAFEDLGKTPEPTVPSSVKRFDPQLGWALQPNSKGTSSRTGYEIEYQINSHGLRDSETTHEKPEGVFRIVLLGDSRTFGYGVPIEKHFSKILEGYFKDVEVINMGVSGYGVDQQLLQLRSEGCRYKPDLVLAYVAHYGNHRHMYSKRFGRQKPQFQLDDGKLVLTNVPVPGKANPERQSILSAPYRWLTEHTRTFGVLETSLRQLRKKFRSSKGRQAQQGKAKVRDPGFEDRLHELGEAIIFEMNSQSSKCGAVFVLVNEIDRLHAAAAENNIPSINVAKALRNKTFPLPDKLKHINESGNGVLAWEIAEFLRMNRLVPDEHLAP